MPKITELPLAVPSDLSDGDIFPLVDEPEGGTPRTKRAKLGDIFTIAPVKSVNGLTTGDISLASTHLTDASTIGRILNINGHTTGEVSLGSSDLSDGTDVALKSSLGSVQDFTDEYNNPTTDTLTKEYQELARLLGNDQVNLRASLFAVQQTANNALPTQTANNTYATKVSLGQYSKTSEIQNEYFSKNEVNNTFSTKVSLGLYTKTADLENSYATKAEVTQLVEGNSGSTASVFATNHIQAVSASIATSISTNQVNVSNGNVVAKNLSALSQLSALRAEVGNGLNNATGLNSTLVVKGNTHIDGNLSAKSIDVLGSVLVRDTQVVKISDDIIELNVDENNNPTSNTGGGIQVNRGSSADKANLLWDQGNETWTAKLGSAYAKLVYSNAYADTASLPSASDHKGMFAMADTTPLVSDGTNWVQISGGGSSSDIGTYEDFLLGIE